jgi:hypothetical protein
MGCNASTKTEMEKEETAVLAHANHLAHKNSAAASQLSHWFWALFCCTMLF